jgi:hypothetical protein
MENKRLRVWHIPQVPGKHFFVDVDTPEEGKKIMDVLAAYDQFQFQNRIKPDFCNVQGLNIFDEDSDGEGNADWIDWHDEDDNGIDDYCQNKGIDYWTALKANNDLKF